MCPVRCVTYVSGRSYVASVIDDTELTLESTSASLLSANCPSGDFFGRRLMGRTGQRTVPSLGHFPPRALVDPRRKI